MQVLIKINKDCLDIEDSANTLVGHVESRNGVVKAWEYFGNLNPTLHAEQAR